MTEENIESKAKSFTTRVPADMWDKIEEYKKYGNWNTNQLMNHALTAFFDIVEDKEENPELPLVCETLRELSRKTRSRLMHSSYRICFWSVCKAGDFCKEVSGISLDILDSITLADYGQPGVTVCRFAHTGCSSKKSEQDGLHLFVL